MEQREKLLTTPAIIKLVISIAVGLYICTIPPQPTLGPAAIRFIGIFIGAMLAMVLRALPDWIISLVALFLLVICNVGTFATVFSPMAGTSIWLIIPAFGIAAVMAKTGLLKRIALSILSLFPESFRGQISALFVSGIIISPLIPSTLAKMSIFAPFTASVSDQMGYERGSKGSAGLFMAQWCSAGLLGYGFFSGSFAVFMLLGLLPKQDQAFFHWMSWLETCAPWLIVMTVLSYIFIMFWYKPKEELNLPAGYTKSVLKEMGPMSANEKLAGGILAIILLGWMTQQWHNIDASLIAIAGLCIYAIAGLFKKEEFSSTIPWAELVYMLLIFSVAALIGTLKVNVWLQGILDPILSPLFSNTYLLILAIVITTYILRFFILSQFTIAIVIYAILGGLATAAGMNGLLIVLITYISGNIFMLDFQNVVYVTARTSSKNMIDQKMAIPYASVWLAINLLGWWASVPVWRALGLM
jgi:Di- and tricarboxylate transporters